MATQSRARHFHATAKALNAAASTRGDSSDGVATLEGSGVFLTEGAAELLNTTFGVDALSGATKIGVAKIEAKVPAA